MSEVQRTPENLSKCSCMKCPSYALGCKLASMPKNMMTKLRGNIGEQEHFEGLFCTFGKSKCIKKVTECICEECDVYKENNLKNYGYCVSDGGIASTR